jgi:tetratricopeptide (TPR) repeat protein
MKGRRALLARCAVAASAAALLYLGTTRFDFAYDDPSVVLRHPLVTEEAWHAIPTSPYHVGPDVRIQTGAYRPLTIASLAANHAVSGTAPWSYHLVNVILHAIVSALVVAYAVELGLTPGAALTGGLAFAVHPVHVEAVANVAGRAELLSTALALLGLVAYARARLVALAVLLGAALFAKENAVTVLGVIALWEALKPMPPGRDALRSRVRVSMGPLAAAAVPIAAYLAARFAVLGGLALAPGSVTRIENPIVGLPPVAHAATVFAVFGRAASLLLAPIRLSPDYGFAEIAPQTSFLAPAPLVGAMLLAIVLVLIVFSWRRAPRIAFLLAAVLVTYAIVSNAVVIIGTVLGDRLMYLPSVFACILFGLAQPAAASWAGRRVATAGVAAVLVALAARSAAYVPAWRNDATLFEYAARVAPQSVKALGGWGGVLAEQGRLDEARLVLDRAVAIAPDFIPNRLNRAAVALSTGDLDAAAADAGHVDELEPGNALARRLLDAVAQRRLGPGREGGGS